MARKTSLSTSFSEGDKSSTSKFFVFSNKFCNRHLLAEIKRKGSEHQPAYVEEPMMNAEANKMKKSTAGFNDELNSVKIQQEELGRVGKMIYAQNTQLLNENKLLWNELSKNK